MNMILHNPDIIAPQPTQQPVPQFQQVSPAALRQRISELDNVQAELRDRLHRQEQATRNAIGVGVLSTVLAVTAIGFTFWNQMSAARSGSPIVAASPAGPETPVNDPVLVTMR